MRLVCEAAEARDVVPPSPTQALEGGVAGPDCGGSAEPSHAGSVAVHMVLLGRTGARVAVCVRVVVVVVCVRERECVCRDVFWGKGG